MVNCLAFCSVWASTLSRGSPSTSGKSSVNIWQTQHEIQGLVWYFLPLLNYPLYTDNFRYGPLSVRSNGVWLYNPNVANIFWWQYVHSWITVPSNTVLWMFKTIKKLCKMLLVSPCWDVCVFGRGVCMFVALDCPSLPLKTRKHAQINPYLQTIIRMSLQYPHGKIKNKF